MPILIHRRSFLKNSLGAVAALQARGLKAAPEEVRWALLSDTHLAADANDTYRGFKPAENLRKVVNQVKQSPFDSILVNGDLARLEGTPADYAAFGVYANELAGHAPLALTLGNHDQRANAMAALGKRAGEPQAVAAKMVCTVQAGPVQMVLLDSLMVTNIAAGQLGKAQREWLAGYLGKSRSRPTIIVVHHNPDGGGDTALVDADRLLEIVKPRKQVKAIVFGHTHTYRYAEVEGIQLVNLPAVGYNFADGEVVGWVEATLRAEGGDFRLHAVAGGTQADGKVTSLKWR